MNNSKECAYWVKFFKQAEIPEEIAEDYAVKFVDHRIHKSILGDLTREVLVEMGIKAMGDVIAIMKHSKKVALEVEASRSRRQSSTAVVKTSTISTSPVKASSAAAAKAEPSDEVKKSRKKVIVIKKTPKLAAVEKQTAEMVAAARKADKTKQDKIMRQVSKNNKQQEEDDDDVTVFDRLGPQHVSNDDVINSSPPNTVTSRIEKLKRRSAPASTDRHQNQPRVKRVISARDADVIKKLKLTTTTTSSSSRDVTEEETYATLRSDVTHKQQPARKRVGVTSSSSGMTSSNKTSKKSGGVFGRLGGSRSTSIGSRSGSTSVGSRLGSTVAPSSKPSSVRSRLGDSKPSVKSRVGSGEGTKMASHGIFAGDRLGSTTTSTGVRKPTRDGSDVFARLGGRRR